MSKRAQIFSYSLIFTVISLVLVSVSSKWKLISFINHLFMVGLFLLTVSGAWYVVRGGFFSTFGKSMKKVMKLSRREMENLDDDFLVDDSGSPSKDKKSFFPWWLGTVSFITGLFCTLLSFALIYLL
ncbi:DUF3899 domain-containing protein [Paenactinomyces guangxiensis]|uniref:DUF3899 domain-containing protein n=1 Tax=Paenactinomyces guangxiensis TaxID=1490290 RepID=A0A7W2A823_9BACL|nr:DUF3899 domain-containing protein [Paenactinomyces guangxiensis]MBA4493727.1 DUF3899 domain-containing protein [Paenactinomyces guangxiensis]MBH8591015.1 DUF3899 domain-containing protein [Paenactinomyces guangxiensis]